MLEKKLHADGEEKCGKVTSYSELPDGCHIALGYVRCRTRGMQVDLTGKQVGADKPGRLCVLPGLLSAHLGNASLHARMPQSFHA